MIEGARELLGTGSFVLHEIEHVWPPFRSAFALYVPAGGTPFLSIDCVPVDVRDRIPLKNPDDDRYLSLEGTVEEKDDGEFWISSKKVSIRSDTTCSANSTIRIWKNICGSAPLGMKCGLTNLHFIGWCEETDGADRRVGSEHVDTSTIKDPELSRRVSFPEPGFCEGDTPMISSTLRGRSINWNHRRPGCSADTTSEGISPDRRRVYTLRLFTRGKTVG